MRDRKRERSKSLKNEYKYTKKKSGILFRSRFHADHIYVWTLENVDETTANDNRLVSIDDDVRGVKFEKM